MPETDSRIDLYIEKAPDFAKPVLQHLRELVHQACPQVKETIRLDSPQFLYKGNLCRMAAFEKHCAFSFDKSDMMNESEQFLNSLGLTGINHFDQLISVNDLPADNIVISYIEEAMRLNEEA